MKPEIKKIVREALLEDKAHKDAAGSALFKNEKASGHIVFKGEWGILCGLDCAEAAFKIMDPSVRIKRMKEGSEIKKGAKVLEVAGRAKALLAAERTALNFLGMLTGIATKTRRLVNEAKRLNSTFAVSDTRKTHPLLRSLEKYAVKTGGGEPHRIDLASMAMFKDNHLRIAKRVFGVEWVRRLASANARLRRRKVETEIEAQDTEDLVAALQAGADWVMLDNMEGMGLAKAARVVREAGARLEISGGLREDNIARFASVPADRASSGAIIHSAHFADFSLELF